MPRSETVLIVQNDDRFTMKMNQALYTGTIEDSTYSASGGDGETYGEIMFTLLSADSGSGVYEWAWSDCVDMCHGIGDLSLTRVQTIEPESDSPDCSGSFIYKTSNARNSCPDSGTRSETGSILIDIYNNSTFTILVDDREFTGSYSGETLTYTGSYPLNGGTIVEWTAVQMVSENGGTGSTDWTWGGIFFAAAVALSAVGTEMQNRNWYQI